MRRVNTVALLSALVMFTGAAMAQLPPRPGGVGAVQMAPPAVARIAAVTHGTWEKGPGTYTVTLCSSGCIINGAPGTTINVVVEVWSAGGGGGSGGGVSAGDDHGSAGGGGGGGGAYAKATQQVLLPASGTPVSYQVVVGTGGAAVGYSQSGTGIGAGGASEVKKVGGLVVLRATGGGGANIPFQQHGGTGGTGGVVTDGGGATSAAGHPGGDGAYVNTCNGGGGGLGGVGSGPGAINNGGAGGHGGYYHHLVNPTCTAASMGYALSAGAAGGNGFVRITW